MLISQSLTIIRMGFVILVVNVNFVFVDGQVEDRVVKVVKVAVNLFVHPVALFVVIVIGLIGLYSNDRFGAPTQVDQADESGQFQKCRLCRTHFDDICVAKFRGYNTKLELVVTRYVTIETTCE